MKSLIPNSGNDCIYTPDRLALDIVLHFHPQINGKILEPASGEGSFLRAFKKAVYQTG